MRLRLPLPSWDLRPALRWAGLALLLYFCFLTLRTAWQTRQAAQEVARVQEETRILQDRVHVLEERRSYAQSEEFIERVAREELNLIKPGETAIIVYAPSPPPAPPPLPPAASPPPEPWWQRWWNEFLAHW